GDGIYSRSHRGEADNYHETQNYYKQYFQSKQGAYAPILESEEESAVFTDIEAYSTRDYIGDDGYIYTEEIPLEETETYAGWGQNSTSVSINFYGSGNYYNPYYYNSFYGYWGYPYYRYGFYYPGWYGGFAFSYGWGGYYNPYYYYPNYYYPGWYGGSYYGNVAYNRGRRNAVYSTPRTINSGRSSSSV